MNIKFAHKRIKPRPTNKTTSSLHRAIVKKLVRQNCVAEDSTRDSIRVKNNTCARHVNKDHISQYHSVKYKNVTSNLCMPFLRRLVYSFLENFVCSMLLFVIYKMSVIIDQFQVPSAHWSKDYHNLVSKYNA